MINPKRKKSSKTASHQDVNQFYHGILEGNTTMLSKAITLIESDLNADRAIANQLLQHCLKQPNKAIRIGITGIPGVGKSTFIEALGIYLIKQGKRVAVLAIDPSSSINKGSILGDKTRMEQLVRQPDAYIRPSAAGDSLGGVAKKTKESILLFETAGYDVILVETVGVGQSETLVHDMVDFFLLLKITGSGDELQGIKRGIIEMADAIVINKAEGNNLKKAKLAQKEFQRALHLYPPKTNEWLPQVGLCSALEQTGIEEVWQTISSYIKLTKANGHFNLRRQQQNTKWLHQIINNQLQEAFYGDEQIKTQLTQLLQAIHHNEITPFLAAEQLLNAYKKRGN